MGYDLMLLADPGTERARVIQVLSCAADIRADAGLENRFWLLTDHGEACINIGTKDPVESIHVEFAPGDLSLLEAAARRALDLAASLSMRVEDVQWGAEIQEESLPRLREHWAGAGQGESEPAPPARRPWWRMW